jgi:hypothetical protein
MSISNKYNVPQETITKMIKDGLISGLSPRNIEICDMYKSMLAKGGKSKAQIQRDIADIHDTSDRNIRYIIEKFS